MKLTAIGIKRSGEDKFTVKTTAHIVQDRSHVKRCSICAKAIPCKHIKG